MHLERDLSTRTTQKTTQANATPKDVELYYEEEEKIDDNKTRRRVTTHSILLRSMLSLRLLERQQQQPATTMCGTCAESATCGNKWRAKAKMKTKRANGKRKLTHKREFIHKTGVRERCLQSTQSPHKQRRAHGGVIVWEILCGTRACALCESTRERERAQSAVRTRLFTNRHAHKRTLSAAE